MICPLCGIDFRLFAGIATHVRDDHGIQDCCHRSREITMMSVWSEHLHNQGDGLHEHLLLALLAQGNSV